MTAATSSAATDPLAEALLEQRRARARQRLRGRDSLATILGALGFLVVAAPLALVSLDGDAPSVRAVLVALAAYAIASRVEFEVGTGSAVPTQLVFVPMFVLLPPGLVPLLVAAAFLLGDAPDYVRGRIHPERGLLHLFSSWHAVGPALVLTLAGGPAATWGTAPVFALALAAQVAFDYGSSVVRARLAFGVGLREQLRLTAPVYLVDATLAPAGFLVAMVAGERPLAVLLTLPLIGLLAYFARERRRRIDFALELGQAYRGTALLLGDVIEADDAYTGSHSRDVVELVVAVSDRLALDVRTRRDAELTALLHDVGKIRIPAEIINKPGKLTDEEFAVIKTHTIEGERMLDQVGGVLGDVGRLVRSCHERWDGAGYPDALAGEQIPLVARIVCACDAYNAMTTDRPYRKARPVEEAVAELEHCAGTHFDPAVVAALVETVRPYAV
jgi:HD-GYP domain-containing protein (c-di-GMP phosphodiesterase class II)